MVIERHQLKGGVQGGSRGSSYEERYVQPPRGHFPAEFLHLEEGRGDKPAGTDYSRIVPYGFVYDGLLVHHDTQVNDSESVAGQDYACDVFADVVNVPLYGGIDYHRFVRNFAVLFLHMRFQHGYGVFHDFG